MDEMIVGDIVMLKSGSPRMTIKLTETKSDDSVALCEYYCERTLQFTTIHYS